MRWLTRVLARGLAMSSEQHHTHILVVDVDFALRTFHRQLSVGMRNCYVGYCRRIDCCQLSEEGIAKRLNGHVGKQWSTPFTALI